MKNKYSERISKETWLNLIFKEIDKSEYGAIRPKELKFTASHFYWMNKCTQNELEIKNYGKTYTLWFRPGDSKKADHRARIDGITKSDSISYPQDLKFDFKPIIKSWNEQLYLWHDCFNKWTHSVDVAFDGWLPVECDASFNYFKTYIENLLNEHPGFCVNPFIEQDKLKRMMKKLNELRDPIVNKSISIIKKKMPCENNKRKEFLIREYLLYPVLWRISNDFLYDKKTKGTILSNNVIVTINYNPAIDKNIIERLAMEIKKSPIINRESFFQLWTMISESQEICVDMRKAFELLKRLKD